ncbi:MAG: hypothetical protein NTAFB01_00060 [Nitrospira sp.]
MLVGRNVFSCFPTHDRIAIAPGQGRILVPAGQLQGLWMETEGRSVSQDLGFVEEYETPVGRLVHVKDAIHCEHSNGL